MSHEENRPRRSGLMTGLLIVLAVCLAVVVALAAARFDESAHGLNDGYYTAQIKEYDEEGWREYLTIFVNYGAVATAEFNAVNSSGMLRSWDQEYIRKGFLKHKVNPNQFSRLYTGRLVSFQNPGGVLPAYPGRKSHDIFIRLAEAALASSRLGRLEVAEVDRPETRFPDDI